MTEKNEPNFKSDAWAMWKRLKVSEWQYDRSCEADSDEDSIDDKLIDVD